VLKKLAIMVTIFLALPRYELTPRDRTWEIHSNHVAIGTTE